MLMSLKGFHVVLVRRISLGSAASVRPTSTALSLSGAFRGAGASPFCLGARGALCPGHVVSSSQVGNIETDNHSHTLAPKVNSESSTRPQMHAFGPEGSQGTRGEPAWKREEHAHRKAPGPGRSEPKTLLLRRLKWIKPGLRSHEATGTMFGAILFLGNDDFLSKDGKLNTSILCLRLLDIAMRRDRNK